MDETDRLSLDFATRHPDSFARTLGRGANNECERIVNGLPPDRKAGIVARLPSAQVRYLLDSNHSSPADWLVDAPFDDAVTFLSRIPRDRRLALVNSLEDSKRQRRLLRNQQYPAYRVGSLVSDIPLRVHAESSAAEVLAEMRELDLGSQDPVVIVDSDGQYLGMLDRWRLLLRNSASGSAGDHLVAIAALRPEMPVTDAAAYQEWHTCSWLPVVDHRHRLLGVVSREKLFRAASAHVGSAQRGGDLFFELLVDLIYLCETLVLKAFSSRDAT